MSMALKHLCDLLEDLESDGADLIKHKEVCDRDVRANKEKIVDVEQAIKLLEMGHPLESVKVVRKTP